MKYKTIAVSSYSRIGLLLSNEIQPIINFFQEQISAGKSVFQQRLNELEKMLNGLKRCDNFLFRDFLAKVDSFDNRQEISLLSIKRGFSLVQFRQDITSFSSPVSADIDSWINEFCITQNIANSKGDIYEVCTLRSDLNEDDLKRADALIPNLYDFLLKETGETEDYLYWDEGEHSSKLDIYVDVFKALTLSEPVHPAFGQKAIFSWNHTHPTRIEEVQTDYSKRSGYYFSNADLNIVKDDVERNAEVFSAYGISFIDRDYTYLDLQGNSTRLQTSSGYVNYVHRLLVFRDVYSYLSKESSISDANKVQVAFLMTRNLVNMNSINEILSSLKDLGLENSLVDKFLNNISDVQSESGTFFGMHSSYPEVEALKRGQVSYFINRSKINRMMERTELGNMKYQEAIEFIKLRSSKVLRLMLCEKYDLSDLFIRDRRFSGHKFVSASAKKEYIPLFNELWNSKNLTEARTVRDKIFKVFDDLYKAGKLYED